jgi:NitT/TauT family transport system substrate-binding protein
MLYKRLLLTAVAVALMTGVTACSQNDIDDDYEVAVVTEPTTEDVTESDAPAETEKVTINLGLYKGADAFVAARLMSGSDNGTSYENYKCSTYNNADEVDSAFLNGDIQAAIVPADKAAQLYNATGGTARVAAISAKCNYYIADTTSSVKSLDSLAGQTIYLAKDDSLATAMLNILLDKNGITSCKIEYMDDSDSLTAALASGEVKVALLQEPFISEAVENNSAVNIALDLYDLWDDTTGTELATGCFVINSELAKNSSVFDYFKKDFEAAVNMTKHNMDETATLAKKYEMVNSASAAKASIPGCSISNTVGENMRTSLEELYALLYSNDDDSLGGNVPNADFYLIK